MDRQKATSRLQAPAIGLIVLAAFNVLLFGILTPVLAAEVITGKHVITDAGDPLVEPGAVIGVLVVALLQVAALYGAIQMLRARSKAWSNFAAIMAMLPCTPCCLPGFLVGIWALVVVNQAPPEVWS